MADSRHNHAQHDLELVASYAAGEATGAELDRAERLLDDCDRCVTVARELRALTLAVQDLPSVAELAARGELPPAPRDFRLTAEQAASLKPTAGPAVLAPVIRWTDRLGGAITAFGRPVGASLAAIGLVGVLVSAATLSSLGGGSSAAATSAPIAADANGSLAPNPGGGAAGAQPAASAGDTQRTEFGTSLASPGPASSGGAAETTRRSATTAPGVEGGASAGSDAGGSPATWLLLLSLVAVAGGVVLIVVATRRA